MSALQVSFGQFDGPVCTDPFLNGPVLNPACGHLLSQCALFLTMINTIVQNDNKISRSRERVVPVSKPSEAYDFVVIGGKFKKTVRFLRFSNVNA